MRLSPSSLAILAALAAGSAVTVPTLATAQTIDEVVVLPGRFDREGRPISLSRAVSYADLDLTTRTGQDDLRMRVRATARDICRVLGENDAPTAPLTSG